MRKYLLGVFGGFGVRAASPFLLNSDPVVLQTTSTQCMTPLAEYRSQPAIAHGFLWVRP